MTWKEIVKSVKSANKLCGFETWWVCPFCWIEGILAARRSR